MKDKCMEILVFLFSSGSRNKELVIKRDYRLKIMISYLDITNI
ncbi:hypothetical protein DOT_1841 [Desulfosporosinus sp. OT]|nr:hypothetical protein DOT_1841 [Desulfosporosinus sp. OT]